MTALFSAHRRAEEFAAAVDAPHQGVRDELRPLVDVVGALRTHVASDPDAVPRAEFAADLRARLMAEAAESMTPDAVLVLPTRVRGRRERRLVAAASAAVLLGGTAGIAAAAQDALPGDALYPVKRGLERVEAGVSITQTGKGRELLHQASGRLVEVDGLLAGDGVTASRVPAALQDFTAQAEQGGDLLLGAFEDTRDPDAVRTVREFTASGIRTLQELARTAPPEAQEDLTTAALALRAIDRRAVTLCASCASDLPPLEVPGILLVATEAGRALTAVDPATLDNSHPFLAPKGLTARDGRDGGSPAKSGQGSGGSNDVTGGATDGVTGSLPGTGGSGGSDGGSGGGGAGPVPDTKQSTETAEKKVRDTAEDLGETAGGTVGSITDGLGGAVETVVPDPVPQLPAPPAAPQPGSLLP